MSDQHKLDEDKIRLHFRNARHGIGGDIDYHERKSRLIGWSFAKKKKQTNHLQFEIKINLP